jgi:hypothetical protein
MPVSPTAELESIKGMMDEASLITVAHPPFTVSSLFLGSIFR